MLHAETPRLAADADEQLDYDFEVDTAPDAAADPAEAPADHYSEPEPDDALEAAALCPACGELLAWHDEFSSCRQPAAAPALAPPAAGAPPASPALDAEAEAPERPNLFAPATRAQASFAYELGRRVQPAPALTAEVIWRGQLKERHPATGLIHRVNVYRLNDGHWDCYREEELQAA